MSSYVFEKICSRRMKGLIIDHTAKNTKEQLEHEQLLLSDETEAMTEPKQL